MKRDGCRSSADNSDDIANLFNNYFASIFTTDENTDVIDGVHDSLPTAVLTDVQLTEESVHSILKGLNVYKAHGPDEIPTRIITEASFQITSSLIKLFNKSLRTGQLRKNGNSLTLFQSTKKGDIEHAENYRPISLLSLISKTLERCVFNSIKYHVFEQINPSQHGFVAGKSCVTQFVEVLHHIGSQIDQGKQIDLIYLDMSKAFDKVSHMRLINRLRDFGFGGSILNWFSRLFK